jgi:serine/threonine-protein kinase PpkA
MMREPAAMDIKGYELEMLIAEGGMASVYLAVQQSLCRPVALKMLKKFDKQADAQRFLSEGRLIASLDHPNIITIHDIGVAGERHYISMEYLEGGSLEDRIKEGLSVDEALGIAITIGTCLEVVHRQGIIHLDVKPANILFHANGTVKLTDFGIARSVAFDSTQSKEKTALGSPYYISPEQAQAQPVDGRADIYSLGIILYEMLTNRKPYQADSHMETIVAHVTRPLPSLPEELAVLQEALAKMIAKKPEQRFASAAEMVGYLKAMQWVMAATHGTRVSKGASGDSRATLGSRWRSRLKANPWRGARSFRARRFTQWTAVGAACLVALLGFRYTQKGPGEASSAQLGAVAPGVQELAVVVADTPAGSPSGELAPATTFDNGSGSDPQPKALIGLPEDPVAPPQIEGSEAGGEEEVGQSLIAKAAPTSQTDSTDGAAGGQGLLPAGAPQSQAESAPPREDGSPSIEELLAEAQASLDDYRLMVPANNNAFHFYSEVLAREPGREEALEGLDRIARRYAGLAKTEIDRGNHRKARMYLQRGLQVRGGDERLLQLKAELHAREQQREEQRQAELLAQREADLRAQQAAAEPQDKPKNKNLFEKIQTFFAKP